MEDNKLFDLMMVVSDRLARIEVKSEELRTDLKEHLKDIAILRQKVEDIDREVTRAKASISTLRWVIAGTFGIPGVIIAILKIVESF